MLDAEDDEFCGLYHRYADFGYNVSAHASKCTLNGGGESCVISGIVELFGCEDETTEDIFQCEHSDKDPDPELSYSFDLADGDAHAANA